MKSEEPGERRAEIALPELDEIQKKVITREHWQTTAVPHNPLQAHDPRSMPAQNLCSLIRMCPSPHFCRCPTFRLLEHWFVGVKK